MSMQTVEYQGYGIDLRRFHSSNPDFNNFLHEIIDDDDFYDVMMHSQDVVVATATNTDSFTFLVYIPAVIPVATSNVKTYTLTEANNLIFKVVKDAIESSKSTEEMISATSLPAFFNELKQFIDQSADFSYNQDWTDLV